MSQQKLCKDLNSSNFDKMLSSVIRFNTNFWKVLDMSCEKEGMFFLRWYCLGVEKLG